MAGHSHWAGIKHKKEIVDQKRGRVFAKLLRAISVAARNEPNPDFNPRLRTAVLKAREASVPVDKIEHAIRRAREVGGGVEEFLFEAYGPGGTALLIEAASDSRNRTVAEIKKLLVDAGGKWAEVGSVRWAFGRNPEGGWFPKFPSSVPEKERQKLFLLVRAIEAHDDVQEVYANAD